ncbi:MarR family transcriptional regulator [Microbacterium sp. LRZ72]|uniref:MarR family winged helix-turn-helix transcriptional regulator n=1 Tax=Microbacterium sp. LRZ72 TaxID=2942481 RepID=UPI0029A51FBF|nr:MarR family transcriptional regulator [Microbacterium sp. LRZ72]MDX2375725.1 MarR family transcriptional regulator [Microbacterium sp. LRZ72]
MNSRDDSVIEVLYALRALGDALDRMHGAMGDDMDMNQTDLRALRMMVERERSGEVVSPHDLARHLRISTASTSKMLDRLEASGHLERRPHPSDRRARIVVLTPHSKQTFFAHFGAHLARMSEVTRDLSLDERRVVASFLSRMAETIDPR